MPEDDERAQTHHSLIFDSKKRDTEMMDHQNDLRLLVFVRPENRSAMSSLEQRMNDFLKSGDGSESLDSKEFSDHHGSGKIADYLLWNRKFVAEMKGVNGYPAQRMERLINDELHKEPRMIVFGEMGIQGILSARGNGAEVNRMMVNIGGRPIRKLLQQANPQISDTRSKLAIPEAAGLAIIMIDSPQKIEASIAAYAIREALTAAEPLLDQIDFVWVSIEAHKVRLPDGRLGFPELGVWRADSRPDTDRAMMGHMFDAWAAFNNSELEPLDHTLGWETLNPIGDGWPLKLDIR